MLFLRSLIFNLLCYGTGIIWGLCSALCWLLPKDVRILPMLWWVRFTLWHLRWICGIKVEVINQGTAPPPYPAVILSKHQSTWETWFLQLYFSPVATILKKELLFIPFFGWGVALFQPITIDRTARVKAAKQVKAQGLARLRQGRNVLIFPEGTRVPVGQQRPYARSGVDLATAAGVPVIPVTHNAGRCWPTKSFVKYPGTITVVIGRPINTANQGSREIIEQVKTWIETESRVIGGENTLAQQANT